MAAPRATSTVALRTLTRSSQRHPHTLIRTQRATCRATYASAPLAPQSRTEAPSKPRSRKFHTAGPLAAARDNSTIDFAFLPSAAALYAGPDDADDANLILRMPILPSFDGSTDKSGSAAIEAAAARAAAMPDDPDAAVMRPEISAMSADAVYLPMTELADGHAMNVDFHALADRLVEGVRGLGVPVEQQAGLVKRIFGDIVDDVFGVRDKAVAVPSG